MKKSFKAQLMTGVAAAALIFPFVLGGVGQAHAAQTMSPSEPVVKSANQTTGVSAPTSGTTNPSTSGNNANNTTNNNNTSNNNNTANSNNSGSNKSSKTLTPQQQQQRKAEIANIQKQLATQMQKQQKAEYAKELKQSTPMFVAQGNEVYTMRVVMNKKGGATPLLPTKKKYASTKRFQKIAMRNLRKGYAMLQQARKISSKQARNIQTKQAKALILKYERVGQLPTQKQIKAEQKAAAAKQKNAKNQKSNQSSQNNKAQRNKRRSNRTTKRYNRRANNRKARRSHKRRNYKRLSRRTRKIRKNKNVRRSTRNRISKRINSHRRRTRRHRSNSFTVSYTYLKSEYQKGSQKAAQRSGFNEGPKLDGVDTMFNHYKPNDKRAVIPKSYQIKPNDTTWLVGNHTNNINKIDHMRNVYYYNSQNHGWSNIGYHK